jgi:hypothetical protein
MAKKKAARRVAKTKPKKKALLPGEKLLAREYAKVDEAKRRMRRDLRSRDSLEGLLLGRDNTLAALHRAIPTAHGQAIEDFAEAVYMAVESVIDVQDAVIESQKGKKSR